jgi:hypothetical protein
MTYTDRPTTLSRLYDSLGEIYKCPKYGGLREVAREAAVFGSVGTEQAAGGQGALDRIRGRARSAQAQTAVAVRGAEGAWWCGLKCGLFYGL